MTQTLTNNTYFIFTEDYFSSQGNGEISLIMLFTRFDFIAFVRCYFVFVAMFILVSEVIGGPSSFDFYLYDVRGLMILYLVEYVLLCLPNAFYYLFTFVYLHNMLIRL